MRRDPSYDYRPLELPRFPLLVIGGLIIAILGYLGYSESLSARPSARVYVPLASSTSSPTSSKVAYFVADGKTLAVSLKARPAAFNVASRD